MESLFFKVNFSRQPFSMSCACVCVCVWMRGKECEYKCVDDIFSSFDLILDGCPCWSLSLRFFFLVPFKRREKLSQLIKSNQMKLVNCLFTTQQIERFIRFSAQGGQMPILSCSINYLRKHVHSLLICQIQWGTKPVQQRPSLSSFTLFSDLSLSSFVSANISGVWFIRPVTRCTRPYPMHRHTVCPLAHPCRVSSTNIYITNTIRDKIVHDFCYFCWISFVDINNGCVTNDDGIQLTSKMVTLTSLMNAHRNFFEKILSCQLNGR